MTAETRNCQNCKQNFVIEPDDFSFYEKMQVPPPTWCPRCRLMRRLMWRNERTLYKRTCSLCAKAIIAMYPQDTAFPVYCRECWFSDAWDPLSYGRDYDFSKNLFEQLIDLFNGVPQIALQVSNSPDSDYVNQALNCKNCYLVTAASDNEDCLYSNRVLHCKNVCECLAVHKVESSYEARGCRESSDLIYCDYCHGCLDATFCYDARNCNHCFMSSNLRSKSNMWREQQLTIEEFQEKMKTVNLGSYQNIKNFVAEYNALKAKSVTRFSQQKNTTNCTGDVITNAKNCRNSFYVSEVENANNLLFVDNGKDIYDVNNGCCTMEKIYEVNSCGVNCTNVRLSSEAWPEVQNATYCLSCRHGVHDLFGCVGVRKKAYCILNKEYSPSAYAELVAKITQHMEDVPYVDKKGRVYPFGEFLPPELSPFAFNESAAYTYTPLSRAEAIESGWRWKEPEGRAYVSTITVGNMPDDIGQTSDSITEEVIECEHKGTCEQQCTKAFRIIPAELAFYKLKHIALPRLCPNCRHYERLKNMPFFKLYARKCMCNVAAHAHHEKKRCQNEFQTPYAPDRPEIVYCESCYNSEVV